MEPGKGQRHGVAMAGPHGVEAGVARRRAGPAGDSVVGSASQWDPAGCVLGVMCVGQGGDCELTFPPVLAPPSFLMEK